MRSPRNVVQAPGAGVHARMRRSTAIAGSVHATRASSTVIFGGYEELSARASEPVQQCAAGVRCRYGLGHDAVHGSGVQTLVQAERAGTGDVVAVQDGMLHRSGPAPGREQAEVHVDPAVRRDGERHWRNERPIRHYRAAVGGELGERFEEGGVAGPLGRHDRDAGVVSAGRDWATCSAAASSGRSVGTGDDSNDLVPGGE
jgi:hypothetical protein